jgi:hypothetical protein
LDDGYVCSQGGPTDQLSVHNNLAFITNIVIKELEVDRTFGREEQGLMSFFLGEEYVYSS